MTKTKRTALHHRTVGTLPLPASGYTRTWDSTVKGLHVVATSKGARVYRVRYRLPDDRRADFVIGNVSEIGLTAAREKARELIEEAKTAKTGEDPQTQKVKERTRSDTFESLAESCLDSLSLRPTTERQWRGLVANHLIPRFGNLRPEEIERRDIRAFIEKLGRRTPVLAARTFEVMRRVFSWAVEHEEIKGSPFVGLKKPEKVAEADGLERDRHLNREELHAVFVALQGERFTGTGFDLYIRLLLETAVRREELLKAAWSEVDFRAEFLTIGRLRYKSKRAHAVPLTTAALNALQALKNRAGDSPWVFPGPKPSKPRSSPQRIFEELRRRVGFEDWTLHDLRRTVATELDRLGTAPHVREAILGHAPDKLTRTYSKHVPLLEMRAALEKWSQELQRIIDTAPSVHQFKSQASA